MVRANGTVPAPWQVFTALELGQGYRPDHFRGSYSFVPSFLSLHWVTADCPFVTQSLSCRPPVVLTDSRISSLRLKKNLGFPEARRFPGGSTARVRAQI